MDGWNTEALTNLIAALEDAQTLAYEINCCVRGAYSGARTYEELKEYAEKVADRIKRGAEDCDYAFLERKKVMVKFETFVTEIKDRIPLWM